MQVASSKLLYFVMDRVNKETRYKIMSSNRAKNTSPEVEVRRALFGRGFRFKLHVSNIKGKPDIVLPKYTSIIFVHGCFWHGHECKRHPKAKSNLSFWEQKVRKNRYRDLVVRNELLEAGWRVLVIWECAIRRQTPPFSDSRSLRKIVSWIKGDGKLAFLSESGFEECL